MTIREMQIEIRQGLNQIAANRRKKYQGEELDLVINKVSNSLIRSKIRPRPDGSGGFEIDEINIDDIRTLIVTRKDLVAYYNSDEDGYYSYLPSDYQYLLGDWSYTMPLCGSPKPDVTPAPLYLNWVRQPYSPRDTAPYYSTLEVAFGSSSFTLPDDLPRSDAYTGVMKKEDVTTYIVPAVTGFTGWYWERFGNIYKPYCYLYPSATATASTINVDGSDLPEGSADLLSLRVHTLPQGRQRTLSVNRLTRTNRVANVLNTAYYRTSAHSPISELLGNELYVHSDNSFIVVGTGISYIRKPIPVSLSLSCNSELPEGVHSTICDLAIQYILHEINAQPGVEFKKDDIQQRITL